MLQAAKNFKDLSFSKEKENIYRIFHPGCSKREFRTELEGHRKKRFGAALCLPLNNWGSHPHPRFIKLSPQLL